MVDKVSYSIDLGLSARSVGDDPQSREVHKALHLLAERSNAWVKTASVEVEAGDSSILLAGADVFPEDFDDFVVIGSGIEPTTSAGLDINLELGGVLIADTTYAYGSQVFTAGVWVNTAGSSLVAIPTQTLSGASGGVNHYSYIEIGLRAVHGAVSWKGMEIFCRGSGSTGGGSYQLMTAGIHQNFHTAPITGIQISPSGAVTFASGNFTVYGISK